MRLPFARRRAAPLVTPTFLVVMAATFAYFIAVGALAPTLPLFVEGPLDGTSVEVGLTIGAFAVSAVLLRPLVGSVGDRRGRNVLIIFGGVMVAVSVLGYVLVSSLQPLLLLRLLTGVGEAAFYVGAASVINDIAPEERRGEALSYFSLALFGGLAVGPVVGETALHVQGFDAAWILASSAAGVAGLLGLRVPDTRPEGASERDRTPLLHRAALLPGAVMAANIWGLATFTSFIPLYALEVGLDESRLFFVLYSAISLLIRSAGARLPDVLGPGRCARLALTLVGAGLALMGLWDEPAGLYVGTAIYSVGHALTFPALMTMAIRGAPASERGAVVGTFTMFFDAAFGLGAVSAGWFASFLGYEGSFVAAGFVAGAGLVLLYVRRRIVLAQKADASPEGNAESERMVAS